MYPSPKTPRILSQGGVAIGVPSSGTMGNNGALSALTALPTTYSGGIYLYFPANAIAAGVAAGLYYCIMSSTTAGTVYNNTYTSGVPTAPASPTAFSTTGPGAYTQTTGVDITLRSDPILGGTMGPNGSIRAIPLFVYNNTVGNKTHGVKLSTAYFAFVVTTTSVSIQYNVLIGNSGSQSYQTALGAGLAGVGFGATASVIVGTIDTSVTQSLTHFGNLQTATDFIILGRTIIEVLPS